MPKTTTRTKKASQKSAVTTNELIQIQSDDSTNVLSPVQKRFNSLIKRIEKEKQKLSQWQEAHDFCREKVFNELEPMTDEYAEHQARMVFLIDRHMKTHRFTKLQRKKIKIMIGHLCEESLSVCEIPELKKIYKHYTQVDYDQEMTEYKQSMTEQLKELIEDHLDIELSDDVDLSNLDAVNKFFEEMELKQEAEANARKAQRKKTAKQQAKEAKQKEEEAKASKSIQAIYRELVTSLHPDREQDQQEKERKTQLMKKVTVAYKKKDLLQLLELQLQVEQIDQIKINQIAEERLNYYNKVLQNQLNQIKLEFENLREELILKSGILTYEDLHYYGRPSIKDIKNSLSKDLIKLKIAIEQIAQDFELFQDIKEFKKFLNNVVYNGH